MFFSYLLEDHKGPWSKQEHEPSLPCLPFSGVLCFLVHPGAVVMNADEAKFGQASVRQLVQFYLKRYLMICFEYWVGVSLGICCCCC